LFLKGLPRLCLKMRRPSKSKNPVSDENGPDFYRLPLPTKEQHAVARSNTTTPESEINDPAVEVVDDGPLPFLAHEEERALSPSIVLQSQDAINGNNTFDSFSSNLVFQKVGRDGRTMSQPAQSNLFTQQVGSYQQCTREQNYDFARIDSYNMQAADESSYQMMLPSFEQPQFSVPERRPVATRRSSIPLSTFVSEVSDNNINTHMLQSSEYGSSGDHNVSQQLTCDGLSDKSNGFLSSLQAQISQHQAILAQIQSAQQSLSSSDWNPTYQSFNNDQGWESLFDC